MILINKYKPYRLLLSLLVCVLLMPFLNIQEVQAAELAQEEVPEEAIATPEPPNTQLYSQTATPRQNGEIWHTVLPDQFFYHIAELYGVSLNEILTLNGLTEDSPIFPGDQLLIVKPDDLELGQGTLTPEITSEETELTPEATPSLDLVFFSSEATEELTPTANLGFFERVFSSNARYLALGVLALVLFGVVLLIISSRRIQ